MDELGGLHTAVRRAKKAVGLDVDADVILIPYPVPRSLSDELQDFLQGASADALRWRMLRTLGAEGVLPEVVIRASEWFELLPPRRPLLVPPLFVDIR